MKSIIILLSLVSLTFSNKIFSPEFVENLKKQATWEVQEPEKNKFRDWTIEEIKALFSHENNRYNPVINKNANLRPQKIASKAASSYNFLDNFGFCIVEPFDMGNCGGSYALQSVKAFQHRACQKTGEPKYYSFQDPLSCSSDLTGCTEGSIDKVYNYLQNTGVVDEDCFPYSSSSGQVEACISKCKNDQPWVKHKLASTKNEFKSYDDVCNDLRDNGPITVTVDIYEDFLHYRSGTYSHTAGEYLGQISLELIETRHYVGRFYEEENVCALNSWGEDWGEEGKVTFCWNDSEMHPYYLSGVPL